MLKYLSTPEGFLRYCLDVVATELEPGEAGEGLDGLEGEGSDLVAGEAEGVDGGGEAVRRHLADVVRVEVEAEQPLEGAEEVVREGGQLVLAQEQRGQRAAEVQIVAVRQVHYLVPETRHSLQQQAFISLCSDQKLPSQASSIIAAMDGNKYKVMSLKLPLKV